ncbi:MAG TPA: hypothetical protein DDX33_04250 [Rikenellaceae bacterium]|nr:hypothetical protein [Rikenellaceae bacterium]
MTLFKVRSRILGMAAVIFGCLSCVENDTSLGSDLIPLGQKYKFYTASLPLDNIEICMADSLTGFSTTRITTGAILDQEYGMTTRTSAVTLVPMFIDSLEIGDNPVFKRFRMSICKDTVSTAISSQKNIIQTINIFELSSPIDEEKDFDCNKPLSHASERITKGIPVYNGGDSLSIEFNEAFGRKILNLTKEDLKSYDNYVKKIPGIYFETDKPANEGGRINIFKLQLGYDSNEGVFTGNLAQLDYSAEFEGKRKDTSIMFYFGATKFHDIDSLLQNSSSGKFPQYALNLTSQQTQSKLGMASDKIYIEGGGGLKPVIRASELKRLAEEMIIAKGGDPAHTVINKASLVLPFEFPSDYKDMNRWPQILSPTVKLSSDGQASFMGLTDSSSSAENQGDVNRSLSNYAPDITYHMQEILKIDESKAEDSKTKRFLKGSYDIWMLIMANESITTTSSGNKELSDMYNYLAYQSYYNSMYGGGYGYGSSYGSYYSNYYSYAMMAQYAASAKESTTESVLLDKDRFYRATLNGPTCENGNVPRLELTFAVPLE